MCQVHLMPLCSISRSFNQSYLQNWSLCRGQQQQQKELLTAIATALWFKDLKSAVYTVVTSQQPPFCMEEQFQLWCAPVPCCPSAPLGIPSLQRISFPTGRPYQLCWHLLVSCPADISQFQQAGLYSQLLLEVQAEILNLALSEE